MVHIIASGSRNLGHDIVDGERVTIDAEWSAVFSLLDRVHIGRNVQSVTQGAADGLDTIAKSWAEFNHIQTHDFPADWGYFHSQGNARAAGPVRNRFMVRETIKRFDKENVIVIAFTNKPLADSRGTNNLVETALRQKLPVYVYRADILNDVGLPTLVSTHNVPAFTQ